jgi:pyruvate/2-oxoglutarate dehydrogenase complex dihydrolipoamide dehydrogenase (E3) component
MPVGKRMTINPTTGKRMISENKTSSSSSTTIKENVPIHSRITCACVLGGGAYGTALAQVMARGGTKVQMWVRETEVVQSINMEHENKAFLKGELFG